MGNRWPEETDIKNCTCTPLADDPDCKYHGKQGYVPSGEAPLTLTDLKQHRPVFYKLVTIMGSIIVLLILASIVVFFLSGFIRLIVISITGE